MLSCDQVARELSDAIDGDVSFWRHLQIRLHLAMCQACRGLEASLERTVDALHDLRDAPPRASEPPDDDARDR